METPILARIDQPADLKQLSLPELTQLASKLRHVLLNKVSQTGGHVGPNLGVVELTIAFHTIFNSPVDKVVWDVSHQSYTHKILTGRKQAWLDLAHYNDVSGYTAPEESPTTISILVILQPRLPWQLAWLLLVTLRAKQAMSWQ
ncbi:hypothetical protein TUA1478L_22210 [Lactiplantibacillus plantarum]